MADIEAHPTLDVVWVPKDDDFTVDGITVPSQEQLGKGKPVVAFDASITEPYDGKRVKKYKTWCNSLRTKLQGQFPARKIVFVVQFPYMFTELEPPKTAKRDPGADPHTGEGLGLKMKTDFNRHGDAFNQIWLVDGTGMQKLGVSL